MAKRPSKSRKPKTNRRRTAFNKGIQAAVKQSQVLKKKAAAIAERSGAIYSAVDQMHKGTEKLHHGVKQAHMQIRKARRASAPVRGDGEVEGRDRSLLVAGVGASAGGFEAFMQLLENLSPNTGMAFVFVPHLDPAHESQLSSLIGRITHMHVAEVKDRTRLQPDHIYIIPPNKMLTVSGGVLQLSPRDKAGQFLPIDFFFESLAQDQGNRAIGIVLSGNAQDGTAGIKAIRAGGGITFAQDPTTAKFPGMPQSATSAGVDFVLPPAGIGKELERISHHSTLRRKKAAKAEQELPGSETELVKVLTALRTATGVDFSYYKQTTLQRRILRRMLLKRIDNLKDYVRLLHEHPAEVGLLFDDILINVTGFFRDPGAFQTLRKKIFPKVVKSKTASTPIRIWVPGCATGEEAYSLAICLHEFLGKRNECSIQIFGTDISETMVSRARLGVFSADISQQVGTERLRRYFQRVNGGYQIAKFIRDMCIFARQNVAEDAPFSKLDLISCRNLLIYLGLPLQKKVLPIFHYSLRPGGFLMLGASETIGGFSNLFTLLDKRSKIYIRNETYTRPHMEFQPPAAVEAHEPVAGKTVRQREIVHHFDLQRKADEILLSQFAPPGVIVNARMDVLHFRGKTGPYLEPQPGSASLNLLRMVRDELTADVRTAVMQAQKTDSVVRRGGIRIRFNGHFLDVDIEVVPFKDPHAPERFFFVLFRNVSSLMEAPKGRKSTLRHQKNEREVERLRTELAHTKESLQTIIEEQEGTNEELKSANEEIQSSNEELQSTNEELETAKEELQSTNEELTTLNEELQTRNADLSQANSDLNNLIGSFNMPMVMLGADLTIRRFTPLAQKMFNLIPSDVGRRISDINPNVPIPDLTKLVEDVIETLTMKDVEIQDRDGFWYSLRVRPYRTADNKIDGAVMVMVDIGEVRQGLEETVEMVRDPMLILSADFRVNKANDAFYHQFKVDERETVGRSVFALGNGQWDIPRLRTLLESVLPENHRVEDFRVEHDFPGIGRCKFSFSARSLYQKSKGTHYVLVLIEEVEDAGGEK